MMKKITMLICLAVLMAGCAHREELNKGSQEKEEQKQNYCDEEAGVCSLPEPSKESSAVSFMTKISMQEALSMLKEKKDALFYFGYPDCPWCKEAIPVLKEVSTEKKKTVYYIQTRDEKKELLYSAKEKAKLTPYLRSYMKQDEKKEYQLYVPLVVMVEKGKVLKGHLGTVDGHDAHERLMTEDEVKELKKIYEEMLS